MRSAFRGKFLGAPSRLRWALAAILLALYIAHFVTGDHGLLRRLELERELAEMGTANTKLGLMKERLVQEVQLKEDDPMSLERLAREKYWMIGPGEVVYRFQEDEIVPEVSLLDEKVAGTPSLSGTATGEIGEAKENPDASGGADNP